MAHPPIVRRRARPGRAEAARPPQSIGKTLIHGGSRGQLNNKWHPRPSPPSSTPNRRLRGGVSSASTARRVVGRLNLVLTKGYAARRVHGNRVAPVGFHG